MKIFALPQIRNPTKGLRALMPKPPRMRFLLFGLTFYHVLADMRASCPLTPIGGYKRQSLQNVWLIRAGIEYGPVVQPSVLRVDVQSPLSGDTDPFRQDNNEGEDKALQATFHVYTGEFSLT